MTATQVLAELKMLDKRITSAIDDGTFIAAMQPKSSAKTVDEVQSNINASFQRVTALIARQNAMKMALVMSNATSKVTVGTKTYTVAEAIDAKNHAMRYKNKLLQAMASQTANAHNMYKRMVTDVEKAAMELVKKSGEDPNGESAKDLEIYKSYIERNEIVMVDPLGMADMLVRMSDEIDEFVLNVDTALSIANATTSINFTYDDGNTDPDPSPKEADIVGA